MPRRWLLGGWTATFGYLPAFGIADGLVLAGAAIVGLLGTSVGDALAGRVAESSRPDPSADAGDPDEPADARSR